jgi:hypothetical protein
MSESDKDSLAPVNTEAASSAPDVWADRKKNSIRLGWICGAVVMAVFFLAIWRLRIT